MAAKSSPQPDVPASGVDRLEAQAREYGEFVAIERILIDGVPAFNPGDAVPVSHLDRGVVAQEQVARRDTKAAEAATSTET